MYHQLSSNKEMSYYPPLPSNEELWCYRPNNWEFKVVNDKIIVVWKKM